MNNITEAFKDKTLVITGGTGSFGSTVLKHFLTTDIGEIRIISRDEKKQDWMRHTLQAQYPDYAGKVQFYVGDVRNLDSLRDVMHGANYVFHAAALKEVPSCEFFPMEGSEPTSSVRITLSRRRLRIMLSGSFSCLQTKQPTPSTPWA